MLNELIEKIAAQTGLPAATVMPVVGALLSHLSDILPPPIAHMVAVAMGIHEDPSMPGLNPQQAQPAQQAQQDGGGLGGLLGGLMGGGVQHPGGAAGGNDPMSAILGSFLGGGQGGGASAQSGQFAGAGALASIAELLLGSLLAGRR